LTAVILFVFSVALCSYKYWMWWADKDARISKLLPWVTTHAPVTSMGFAFWVVILVGHPFLPQIPFTRKYQFHSTGQ
jgi:hypothetical protein